MLDKIVNEKDTAIDAIYANVSKQREQIFEDINNLYAKLSDVDSRAEKAIAEIMDVYYKNVEKETQKYLEDSLPVYEEEKSEKYK